jgi:WD40 repeat protein
MNWIARIGRRRENDLIHHESSSTGAQRGKRGSEPGAIRGRQHGGLFSHHVRPREPHDGLLVRSDPESAQELFTLAGHKSAVTALSWRGDSKLLASSSEDGTVKLWEMDEGKPAKIWTAHAAGVLAVNYAHADRLVTCGRDNAVTLWDGNGEKLRDLEKCCQLPLRVSFSSDGDRVFASDFDGRVMVWNVADGKRIGSLDANPLPATQTLAATQNRSSE